MIRQIALKREQIGEQPLLWAALTVPFVVFGAWEAVQLWRIIGDQQAIGIDLVFYQEMGRRWLETGAFYGERQLAGEYETTTLIDNLYPPHAIFLFVPFVFLPPILWWAIPLAVVAYAVIRLRPQPWSWPLLAIVLALPKSIASVIFGNSDLWVIAAVAAAVLWGWPAVLATFKPSLAFFVLIGIKRRRWWIGAAVLALASLPFLPLWLQYPAVMLNSNSEFSYSISNVPFVAFPLLAWLVATDRPPLGGPVRPLFRALSPIPRGLRVKKGSPDGIG